MISRVTRFICIALASSLIGCRLGNEETMVERASSFPPRKVVVATVMKNFTGTMDTRLSMAEQVIDEAAAIAKKKYGKLDLVVLPEHAIQTEHRGQGVTAAEKAVPLEGPVTDRMA